MRQKLIYEIEERGGRYYVWYVTPGSMTRTVFDVCATREDAENAIQQHKRGEHATQWTPK